MFQGHSAEVLMRLGFTKDIEGLKNRRNKRN